MVRFSMLALAVVSFSLVSLTLKAEDPTKEVTVGGVVKSVDAEKGTFVLIMIGQVQEEAKEVTVTTDKATKFLDAEGKESTMADVVKEKANLKVTYNAEHKASKVKTLRNVGS